MTAAEDTVIDACDACLTRTWLLQELAGRIDRVRSQVLELLALDDGALIEALVRREPDVVHEARERFLAAGCDGARERALAGGMGVVCRCSPAYPASLRELDAPPAVLHVAGAPGRLECALAVPAVSIVGSRRCSGYGREVATSLARDLAGSGTAVISGMAFGIDAAAHNGALSAGADQPRAAQPRGAQPGAARPGTGSSDTGITVAVMPGPANVAYPASGRGLHRQILERGVAISELGPGAEPRRWSFIARNRIIAALGVMTVVVEAGAKSGSLVTARAAAALGREVGAVPGRVTSAQSIGTNALLAEGTAVVRGAQDVLDRLYGVGARVASRARRPALQPDRQRLLDAVGAGAETVGALAAAGFEPDGLLVDLAALELDGWLRRDAGGRFVAMP